MFSYWWLSRPGKIYFNYDYSDRPLRKILSYACEMKIILRSEHIGCISVCIIVIASLLHYENVLTVFQRCVNDALTYALMYNANANASLMHR